MAKTSTLQATLTELIESQPDDLRLRDHLEGLARDEKFPGLTWFWGPLLYARSRPVFRSLILQYFSTWDRRRSGWKRIPWSRHAESLEAWLQTARAARDTRLVQQLLLWKFAARGWGIHPKKWNAALIQAYQEAGNAAERDIVLSEFDAWFDLDEPTALTLYQRDARSASFILRHLRGSAWGSDQRALWKELGTAAREAGDLDFYFELYRRQVPIKVWKSDILGLANEVQDPETLNQELEKRHPQGWWLKLGPGALELLEARGRDVMPYIGPKLADFLGGGWFHDGADGFAKFAEQREWWDLWAGAIRTGRNPKLFNKAIEQLLDQQPMSDADRLERLRALAGVSREWNWSGFGIAQVHSLDDALAVRLYRNYPDLIHGPYRAHVSPTWWLGFPKLLAAAMQSDDESLIDLLASRYTTHVDYGPFGRPAKKQTPAQTASELARYYQEIRDRDSVQFAQRAANVLTRIPAYAIFQYPLLLKSNPLARLLFVRSSDAYLASPASLTDLVEASDIHVQRLAYHVLGQDDAVAQAVAVANIEILLGTLLRPLHRKTRLAAFGALLNAAKGDTLVAERVIARIRLAMRLPDKNYPKEELVGLLGRILHCRPEYRQAGEHPVVYGLEASL